MSFTAELIKIINMRSTFRRYSEFHAVRDLQVASGGSRWLQPLRLHRSVFRLKNANFC